MKRVLFVSIVLFLFVESGQGSETPRITDGCNTQVSVTPGNDASIDVDARGDNCDTLIWSLGAITPGPVGTVTISQRGLVRFGSAASDSGLYTVEVIVTNENGAADSCTVSFNVFVPTPYKLRIQTAHNSIMGATEQVNVTFEAGSSTFTGFDLLIAYEDSLLDLLDVLPGETLFSDTGCGWEYFDYQIYPDGMVRVTGRSREAHEDCQADCPITELMPLNLFTLDFMVGKERCRTDCSFHPVRFIWLDCNSNMLTQGMNEASLISRSIYDPIWYGEDIADSTANIYPTYFGAQLCADSCRTAMERFVDFYNGGIDVVCAGFIDVRGDLNLNEIRYEVEDVELYAEYFLHGLDVFRVNQQGQIQASDVNYDSLTLTVADLAFMTNIIANNLTIPDYPCQSITPPTVGLKYHVCDGTVAVDRPIGAALLVAKGNVTPTLLATQMKMTYHFDGENTRILIYANPGADSLESFSGDFVAGIGALVSAEFGSSEGGTVIPYFEISPCDTTLFRVRIEKVENATPGQHVSVDVILEQGTLDLGGFSFMVSFDTLALSFEGVRAGPDWFGDSAGCRWDYFAFRNYETGSCPDCFADRIKVVSIADVDPPFGHPSCFIPPVLPSVIFTLNFIVSDERKYENEFLPLRFFWTRCGMNGLVNMGGDTGYISRNVYDYDETTNITDSNGTYPTINGDQRCEDVHSPDWVRAIDFVNGGIQVIADTAANTTPTKISIEKTHNSYQGVSESVDIVWEKGTQQLGGFDLLIAYENNALRIGAVMPNRDFFYDSTGCAWEYFTYRYYDFGECGSACATGKVRVVGIAETNNGMNHPNCFIPPTFPMVLFTIDFLVSDNRTFGCQFLPIQFVWFDCGDNVLSNVYGDTILVSQTVFDSANGVNIADSLDSYPTFKGAQHCDDLYPHGPHPVRGVDFVSGGIQVQCQGMIDARGDINLNEISNEIDDVTLFGNYFLYGLSVFHVNVQGQEAATDVNADGATLTLADLVYLQRVIVGDASPFPRTSPPVMDASYTIANGKISIDSTVAAAVIVVGGNVAPKLCAPNMDMRYAFDGTNTHILVYTNIENSMTVETFTGTFVAVIGTVLSVEFATPQGGMVTASQSTGKLQDFILGQNYPNPFNQTTRISFSLPQATDYTLCVYNIGGQKVFESQGRGTAGINSVEWTAAHEASGIYFYKLTSGNVSETKKMIFLK